MCFTISWVKAAKTIVHTLITVSGGGWAMDGERDKRYRSVYETVLKHPRSFKIPLEGPFYKQLQQ